MHLWCKFYLSQPMFAEAQLDGLQTVINKHLPEWSKALRVTKDETTKYGIIVGRERRLHECVHQFAPRKRRLADATLTGSDRRLSFFLDHCEPTLPVELNKFTIEVYGPTTVEEKDTCDWARDIFEVIVTNCPVRYGHSYVDEEFHAKNMIDDETGLEAIGVFLGESLPGLYWLNYFGAPYVDLMGRDRLLTAPAFEVKPAGDGILLALDSSASAWQDAAYRQREQQVLAHLGEQYFFSRDDPDRPTVAPEFTRQGY